MRKGQVLAEMDPRDYQVQLAATTAEYQQIKKRGRTGHPALPTGKRVGKRLRQGCGWIGANHGEVRSAQKRAGRHTAHRSFRRLCCRNVSSTVTKPLPQAHRCFPSSVPGNPEVTVNIPAEDFVQPRSGLRPFPARPRCTPTWCSLLDFHFRQPKSQLEPALQSCGCKVRGEAGQPDALAGAFHHGNHPAPTPRQPTLVSIPATALFEHDGQVAVWLRTRIATSQAVSRKATLRY